MGDNLYTARPVNGARAFTLRMRDVQIRLRRSAFLRNVMIVMTGTAAAQAIGFALTPIISRLFSPSDFGVFGSFGAVLTVVAAGVTLDYSQALMLPKKQEDAINLFAVACVSVAIIGLLCLVACLFFTDLFQDIIKTPNIWPLALLIVAIIITGFNQTCQAWCVRVKAFKATSASQVVRSLSSSGAQIGLGYLKAGSIGLIVSSILADILASINLVRIVYRDMWPLRREIGWARMKLVAKAYRDFPAYSASMNVINALSIGLPVLLLTHFYGIAVAGAYAFGMRVLSAPMEFILRALRQVLFQKAAETQNLGGRLFPIYVKITGGLFALAFLPSLLLFIWSPHLFAWLFGAQWLEAGEFARFLTLWLLFMFCNLPSVLFARVIRIQRKMFIFDITLLCARSIVLVFGGVYLSALQTIILFSVLSAVMNVVFIVIVGYVLMKREETGGVSGLLNELKG